MSDLGRPSLPCSKITLVGLYKLQVRKKRYRQQGQGETRDHQDASQPYGMRQNGVDGK
jgi:hypothetical protein